MEPVQDRRPAIINRLADLEEHEVEDRLRAHHLGISHAAFVKRKALLHAQVEEIREAEKNRARGFE